MKTRIHTFIADFQMTTGLPAMVETLLVKTQSALLPDRITKAFQHWLVITGVRKKVKAIR